MMKIAVFYFSGTGNTWWLVSTFKGIAESKGHQVTMVPIERLASMDLEAVTDAWRDADAVGLAYPIYSSDAPPMLRRFLTMMKDADMRRYGEKDAFVLTTMDSFSGDGALQLRTEMEACGLVLRVSRDFRVTSNIGIPYLRFNPDSDNEIAERLTKTRTELEDTAEAIFAGAEMIKVQWSHVGRFYGWLQRVGPKMKDRTWRMLGTSTERCTMCLQCLEQCPADAITLADDKLVWTDACTDCLRCYNFCPEKAITVRGKAIVDGKHRQHTYFRGRGFPP